MCRAFVFSFVLLAVSCASAQTADSRIPSFAATALSSKKVTSDALIGQPTILIVTPSKGAADDTRKWAKALRKNIDQSAVRIRDVLAIDLPFFMSESDAIGRAKEKIPPRYYDQTWILDGSVLEKALNIPPGSHDAFVFVLNKEGKIVARLAGGPTDERVGEVQSAVARTKS